MSTATIEVRTKTGVPGIRCGLAFGPTWAAFELTREQLARIEADPRLEVRAPGAGRRDSTEQTSEGSTPPGEAEALREQLAAAHERIVELEAELASAQQAAQDALAELETLTAPAPPAPPAPAAPEPPAPPAPPSGP